MKYHRLSLLIPLVLVIVSLANSLLIYYQEDMANRKLIEKRASKELGLQMDMLQNILYNKLTAGEEQQALLSLSLSAMYPGVQTVLLADENNKIVMSSRYGWKGDLATEHTGYNLASSSIAISKGARYLAFNSSNTNLLQGYFPLIIKYEKGGLQKRMGVLYVEYDITGDLNDAREATLMQASIFGLINLLASLFIAVILHLMVTRRTQILANISAKLAAGDYTVRANLKGADELSELGAAYDAMAASIEESHRELRIAAVAFNAQESIMVTDSKANIVRVNKSFEATTGYSSADVIGMNPRILSSGRHDQRFYATMWNALIEQGKWAGEVWDKRKDGSVYPKWLTITAVYNRDQISNYVAVFVDISERKKAEEEIRNLAFFDPLTMLPNRRLLMDRLHLALVQSQRSRHYGAVLFLDLDHFKILNDTKGHAFGDLMLIEVAQRITRCIRGADSVARFGGDEFVILLEGLSAEQSEAVQQASQVAEKIRECLSETYVLNDYEHESSPSIGVSLFLGEEVGIDELLKRTDVAMYQAKEAGRNTVRFFELSMQATLEARALMENALRHALANNELSIHFQLQTNRNHSLLGAEVLLRWNSPVLGMLAPSEFIPLAEQTKLILPIGYWVLESACKQIKKWEQDPIAKALTLSVNVSPVQFHQPNFVAQVKSILHSTGANPVRLELELTENLVLENVELAIEKMATLREIGVRFSMDDFGTGYSSLQYIKRLPINMLKIDQSFVRDILTDPGDAVMVQTISELAKNFGFDVIAEGVEESAQIASLIARGCESFQGYLFSRPIPIDEFENLLGCWDERSRSAAPAEVVA